MDRKPSQSLYTKNGFYLNPVVFIVSAVLIIAFVAGGVLFTKEAGAAAGALQNAIAGGMGWFYTAVVGIMLFFVVGLLFSPFARIRLGPPDSRPEFSNLSWFAMLFSAGMGIGLLFYGVAEPILHFSSPPSGPGGTPEAARRSMQLTFFHWGLHAWAIYIVMGLALAYYTHRKGLPLAIRSAFQPLLGDRIHGRLGDVIDIFAVFGTLFGIATSLGLGVMQVNAGLHHLGVMEISPTNQLILIAAITLVATVSVISGVGRGILWLSNANLAMGTLLMLFVFLAGPTLFLLNALIGNTGDYLQNLIALTFDSAPYQDQKWRKSWTLFYWAWWIAWSPFVGMFIARISRGRTIREFITGVLLVPAALTFVWLTVFGNTAIHMELNPAQYGGAGIVEAVKKSIPTALYVMLAKLPLFSITALLATIVVASYFITSSDSGSLVIDILTAGGNQDPPVKQRVFWAVMEGAVAAVLLLAGGKAALTVLQTASITMGLPLAIILLLIMWGLLRSFRAEVKD